MRKGALKASCGIDTLPVLRSVSGRVGPLVEWSAFRTLPLLTRARTPPSSDDES